MLQQDDVGGPGTPELGREVLTLGERDVWHWNGHWHHTLVGLHGTELQNCQTTTEM